MTEDKENNIYASLCKFQGEMPTIKQERKGYNFTYCDLTDIWDAIRKPLAENGFSLVQLINTEEGCTYVLTRLYHVSGESIESKTLIEFTAKKFQEVGSAITYYRRYALSAMLGIVSDEDVDSKSPKDGEEIYKKEDVTISKQQLENIKNLINGHDDIREKMLSGYQKSLKNIPKKDYDKVISTINVRIKDKNK